jgi:heme exporter protein CcmD
MESLPTHVAYIAAAYAVSAAALGALAFYIIKRDRIVRREQSRND